MTCRIIIATAICALSVISGCGRAAKESELPAKALPTTNSPGMPGNAENDQATVDLGGPCLPRGSRQTLALTGKQEEQLHGNEEWDTLIAAARQDVRGDCSVPYRWTRLFTAFVAGHHYNEAVQVLNEMATRGFPMPHAIISQADPSFRESNEFKQSAKGIEFAAREKEVQLALQQAENELASMKDKDLPPNPYRHEGACPFECCTYRQWKTRSAVRLRESIESSAIVAEVPAGVSVAGLTGEVRVEPQPYSVLEDNGALKAGDLIFYLDNIGEGYVNYWYHGELNPELGVNEGLLFYSYDDCQPNTARMKGACSLRKLHPEKTFMNEWWVKIRYQGKEGWVLNTGQFDNVDACG